MTVADLIKDSLRALGVLASGETPTAAQLTDAYNTLNDMLDSWAAERLLLYATVRYAATLTPNHDPHTIGSDGSNVGDIPIPRPTGIERVGIISVGTTVERPLSILSDGEYQGISDKTLTGVPNSIWIAPYFPLTYLYLWPIPSAAHSLVLYYPQRIYRFDFVGSVTDNISVPPGYVRALRFNLALELAPEYGVAPDQTLLAIASEAKTTLKRQNLQPSYLQADPAILGGGSLFNLVSGDE